METLLLGNPEVGFLKKKRSQQFCFASCKALVERKQNSMSRSQCYMK